MTGQSARGDILPVGGRGVSFALAALALVMAGHSAAAQSAADGAGPTLRIEVAGDTEGEIVIDLFEEAAPNHVDRIATLAEAGAYDGVVFHRVIDGFMAQTGDVEFGTAGGDLSRAGTGGSDRPDLAAELSDIPFERGTVGMARGRSLDSANSQFFIAYARAAHLDGKYTVVGEVTEGMAVVDALAKGDPDRGGRVAEPDRMAEVTVTR